jgi:DNA repair protein RecO (recombination protein O)
MDFFDDAIVLSVRPHGENHAVADLFTASNGRWAGLVHGGQGKNRRPLLQPGNRVRCEWKGRLHESLGHFSLELTHAYAAGLMHDRLSLAGLAAACAVARECLPEREPHGRAYAAMTVLIENLGEFEVWPPLMAKWELGLLSELGFGLSLDRCAASGARENLIYVSPRSAAAVSAEAGEPYRERLLALPPFLRNSTAHATLADAIAALHTTGYFIETRILHVANKQLPEARLRLLDLLKDTDSSSR